MFGHFHALNVSHCCSALKVSHYSAFQKEDTVVSIPYSSLDKSQASMAYKRFFSITSSLFYLFFFSLLLLLSFWWESVLDKWNNSFLGKTVIMQHHLGFKQCINQLTFQNGQKPQMPSLIFSISEVGSAKEKPKLHFPFLCSLSKRQHSQFWTIIQEHLNSSFHLRW